MGGGTISASSAQSSSKRDQSFEFQASLVSLMIRSTSDTNASISTELGGDLARNLGIGTAGAVDQIHAFHAPHPGELAAPIRAVGRLHRLAVSGQNLLE